MDSITVIQMRFKRIRLSAMESESDCWSLERLMEQPSMTSAFWCQLYTLDSAVEYVIYMLNIVYFFVILCTLMKAVNE